MLNWWRFWKKSGPNQSLTEAYFLYDDKLYDDEGNIMEECKDWAESIPGGHTTSYRCGCNQVEKPPQLWLASRIKYLRECIEAKQAELQRVGKDLDALHEPKVTVIGRVICTKCWMNGLYRRYDDNRESITFDPESVRKSCGNDANNHTWGELITYWKKIGIIHCKVCNHDKVEGTTFWVKLLLADDTPLMLNVVICKECIRSFVHPLPYEQTDRKEFFLKGRLGEVGGY